MNKIMPTALAPLLQQFEESWNVHPQGAAVFAGRDRKFLTNTGPATMGKDMIVIFFAEMANRGENGVRRRLAEPAQRRFANHAPKFVEQGKLLLRTAAVGDGIENA